MSVIDLNISRSDHTISDKAGDSFIASNTTHVIYLLGPIDFQRWYEYDTVLYGYLCPLIVVILLVTNTIMLKVFVKDKLFSPTNLVLGVIAIVDSVTVTVPGMVKMVVYGIYRYRYYLPYNWCRSYHDFVIVLPSTLHGCSIALTLLLAVQRYIIVAFPLKAKILCSHIRTVLGICVCFIVTFTVGGLDIFAFDYVEVLKPSYDDQNTSMSACGLKASRWAESYGSLSFAAVNELVRAIGLAFVPCVAVLVFDILLWRKCRKNKTIRRQISSESFTSDPEKRLTIASIWMIFAFLLVELPVATITLIDAVNHVFLESVISQDAIELILSVLESLIVLMLPSNFIFYVTFCKSFRQSVIKTIRCQRQL